MDQPTDERDSESSGSWSNSNSNENTNSSGNTDSTGSEDSSASSVAENEAVEEASEEEAAATNAAPDVALSSGVQIQTNANAEGGEGDDTFYLGDRIEIQSKKYGPVKGRIYFFDGESMLRVLPEGVSDRVYDFPIEDGGWAPELGVTDVAFFPGPRTSFKEFQGFRKDQQIQTFKANGEPAGTFRIISVSTDKDAIRIADESGAEEEIDFNAEGIPLEFPFAVIRIDSEIEEEKPLTAEQLAALDEEDEEIEILGEIEIPQFVEIVKRSKSEIFYSELEQKEEFLADLISILPIASQRNPTLAKKLRAFTEMASILKNSIIERGENGIPMGESTISATNLADVLENRAVPMVRPVLQTERVLLDPTLEPTEISSKALSIQSQIDLLQELENYDKTFEFKAPDELGQPRWYQYLQGLFRRYPLGDKYKGDGFTFKKDSEYFRSEPPGTALEGLVSMSNTILDQPKKKKSEYQPTGYYIGQVSMSMRRGLERTLHPLAKGGVETAIPADKATPHSYVLFPYRATQKGAVGSTRTGHLWQDIQRSMEQKEWMSHLLDSLGGVKEVPDAQSILLLSAHTATLANIPFADYLEMLLKHIIPRGAGDLITLLTDYGLLDKEIDQDQASVLQKRVEEVLASLKTTIRTLREGVDQPEPTEQSVLGPDVFARMEEQISGQPLLKELYETFKQRTPGYKKFDVGLTAFLLVYAQDYFYATLSGQSAKISLERLRKTRADKLKQLVDAFAAKQSLLNAGAPPTVNPCQHVANLATIRRVRDEKDRMKLLVKFLTLFKGERKDNWIQCNVCTQDLLCYHEILQLQQYLHPREKDVIQKELVLSFAGGRAGAYHVCRNCGIPISELDFDKNVEFDDEGRPMMGRSELVDKDAVAEEALEGLLKVPIGNEEEEEAISFDSDLKKELYDVSKEIYIRIGIVPDFPSQADIVERAAAEVARLPSEAVYRERTAAKKKEGKKIESYFKFSSTFKVAVVAGLILLDIQTKIPDYVVRYVMEGCKPGFGGYPLVADADPKNQDTSVGIHYMACALTGINSPKVPWVTTEWQRQRSDAARKEEILNKLVPVMRDVLMKDAIQLQKLEEKRTYLRETFGAAAAKGRPSEKIPEGFLPPIRQAEEEIVAEGTNKETNAAYVANLWMRVLDRYVKETARFPPNPIFTTTTALTSTIDGREEYFQSEVKDLPVLPKFMVVLRPYKRQTWVNTPFLPRPLQILDATPPIELAYQVFLKLCWKGPRIGRPHEIGYDHVCDWCGLSLPTEYLYPDVNYSGLPIQKPEEFIQALTSQGLQITTEAFQELSDKANQTLTFTPYMGEKPKSAEALLQDIAVLEPEPVPDFSETLGSLITGFETLNAEGRDTNREIESRLQPLRDLLVATADEKVEGMEKSEDILRKKLGSGNFGVLMAILEEPVPHVFEILRSYFVIPAQRILTGTLGPLAMRKDYGLSKDHMELLQGVLKEHTEFLNKFPLESLNKEKLQYYVSQMSAIFTKANEIRIQRLRNGKYITAELLRVLFFGPLGILIDETIQLNEESIAGEKDLALVKFVWACIGKYRRERLSYSAVAVRERLAEAKEQEKQTFIDREDKMTDEEKQLERVQKKLGIGKWAIGGTSLVYKYDQTFFDQKLKEGQGHVDILLAPDVAVEGAVDAYGVPIHGEDYFDRDGYDLEQHPEDMD